MMQNLTLCEKKASIAAKSVDEQREVVIEAENKIKRYYKLTTLRPDLMTVEDNVLIRSLHCRNFCENCIKELDANLEREEKELEGLVPPYGLAS